MPRQTASAIMFVDAAAISISKLLASSQHGAEQPCWYRGANVKMVARAAPAGYY